MSLPSSKYLSYKHPLWYGCTLQEIMMISLVGLVGVSLVFVVLPCLLGLPAWIGIIVGGIAIKTVVKRMIVAVGDWKKDKPYGYLMTIVFIKCADLGMMTLPYVRRAGPWRTVRRLYRREK